jgi:hypothetical protein
MSTATGSTTSAALVPCVDLSAQTSNKPKTEADYKEWARQALNVDFDAEATSALYGWNVSAAITTVQESTFWRDLDDRLRALAAKYRSDHNADLFPGQPQLVLEKKPYLSAVNKTFRRNVLWNREWPKPPKGGWVTDQSLYSELDDLLRTTIVCRFIDGPELICDDLKKSASDKGLGADIRVLSRDEGYYAHHIYVTHPMSLGSPAQGLVQHNLRVEFQVTTQPQELLRALTHPYYREDRLRPPAERDRWQWDYTTKKFRARYLSHALHLLEALILEVRDKPEDHG